MDEPAYEAEAVGQKKKKKKDCSTMPRWCCHLWATEGTRTHYVWRAGRGHLVFLTDPRLCTHWQLLVLLICGVFFILLISRFLRFSFSTYQEPLMPSSIYFHWTCHISCHISRMGQSISVSLYSPRKFIPYRNVKYENPISLSNL